MLICCIYFSLFTTLAQAQLDANYWSLNYGTKAQILNGAVIGGVDDGSALYYNPAAIGKEEDGGISMSLFSPSVSKVESNSPQFNNREFRNVNLLPNMLEIDFSPFNDEKLKMAFGLFTRIDVNFDLASRFEEALENDQMFVGSANYRNKIKETWLSLGLSFEVNKNFRMGLTQNFSIRGHNQFYFIDGKLLNNTNLNQTLSYNSFLQELKYNNSSFLTKFGLVYKKANISLGLTLTTPKYGAIYSKGAYQYNEIKSYGEFDDYQESGWENKLETEYRTPTIFGFGGVYSFQKGQKFYFSTEYFTEVSRYQLFRGSNPENGLALYDSSDDIINVAVAYENQLSETVTFLSGFRTDFNSARGNQEYFLQRIDRNLYKFSWDVMHFSIGGHFNIKSFEFSAGVDYAFSSNLKGDFFNPYDAIYRNFGIGAPPQAGRRSRYSSLAIFLNYSLLAKRLFK